MNTFPNKKKTIQDEDWKKIKLNKPSKIELIACDTEIKCLNQNEISMKLFGIK